MAAPEDEDFEEVLESNMVRDILEGTLTLQQIDEAVGDATGGAFRPVSLLSCGNPVIRKLIYGAIGLVGSALTVDDLTGNKIFGTAVEGEEDFDEGEEEGDGLEDEEEEQDDDPEAASKRKLAKRQARVVHLRAKKKRVHVARQILRNRSRGQKLHDGLVRVFKKVRQLKLQDRAIERKVVSASGVSPWVQGL